jgi:hypothetical protein
MLEPEWGQHWFHLRCDCDVMEMHRRSCGSFPFELRSSMPNVRLRPMCCVEVRFSLNAGKKTSPDFLLAYDKRFELVLTRRIDSCPIASGNTIEPFQRCDWPQHHGVHPIARQTARKSHDRFTAFFHGANHQHQHRSLCPARRPPLPCSPRRCSPSPARAACTNRTQTSSSPSFLQPAAQASIRSSSSSSSFSSISSISSSTTSTTRSRPHLPTPASNLLAFALLCSALLCSGSSALARPPQSTAVDASSINNPSVLRPHTLGQLEELGLGAGAFSCVFPSADLI